MTHSGVLGIRKSQAF